LISLYNGLMENYIFFMNFRIRFSINLRNVLGVDEIGERISIETTIRNTLFCYLCICAFRLVSVLDICKLMLSMKIHLNEFG